MTVYSIQRDWGPNACLVRIVTDSFIEEVIATGWLGLQEADIIRVNNGPFEWDLSDAVLVTIIDAVTKKASYSAIFSVFADHQSLNPNISLLPNLQNIVAHAGGGQALATQLNLGINVVTVVATAGDSVRLPVDVLGQTVIVSNRGANAMAVFPDTGDQIDTRGVNNPIYIFPGETYEFYGNSAFNWSTINTSPVMPDVQGITAHAGGGQANATQLSIGISVITTVASAGDSVKLPLNTLGQMMFVVNLGANNMELFPALGYAIDALGTNNPLVIAPGQRYILVGATATRLFSIP